MHVCTLDFSVFDAMDRVRWNLSSNYCDAFQNQNQNSRKASCDTGLSQVAFAIVKLLFKETDREGDIVVINLKSTAYILSCIASQFIAT